jgi:hypothetical protein
MHCRQHGLATDITRNRRYSGDARAPVGHPVVDGLSAAPGAKTTAARTRRSTPLSCTHPVPPDHPGHQPPAPHRHCNRRPTFPQIATTRAKLHQRLQEGIATPQGTMPGPAFHRPSAAAKTATAAIRDVPRPMQVFDRASGTRREDGAPDGINVEPFSAASVLDQLEEWSLVLKASPEVIHSLRGFAAASEGRAEVSHGDAGAPPEVGGEAQGASSPQAPKDPPGYRPGRDRWPLPSGPGR